MVKLAARAYAVLVGATILWAWVMEIALRDSPQEHLLPIFALNALSIPTSIGTAYALDALPMSLTFTQVMVIQSIAAICQALVLLKVASLVEMRLIAKAQ